MHLGLPSVARFTGRMVGSGFALGVEFRVGNAGAAGHAALRPIPALPTALLIRIGAVACDRIPYVTPALPCAFSTHRGRMLGLSTWISATKAHRKFVGVTASIVAGQICP